MNDVFPTEYCPTRRTWGLAEKLHCSLGEERNKCS